MEMNMTVTSETRPCLVLHTGKIALWHGFSDRYGSTVVEYKDGTVDVLPQPTDIRFLDSAEKFSGYGWPEADRSDA